MSIIQCIIGLGNPGTDYAKTRHNVGAWFVDLIAQQENASFRLEKKLHGFLSEFVLNDQKCYLFKPTTYMNESGLAVFALIQFYKIPIETILIAHDELDFDVGIVRLKKEGGHGGHNGLRSVIQQCHSANFYRLRIGIGHPGDRDQVANYVLSTPTRDDKITITTALDHASHVIPDLLSGKIQKAFHQLHSE